MLIEAYAYDCREFLKSTASYMWGAKLSDLGLEFKDVEKQTHVEIQ